MTLVVIYVVFIGVMMFQVARRTSAAMYFTNPLRVVPGEPELPAEEAARARGWAEALAAAGYTLHSTNEVDNPSLAGRPPPPRSWLVAYEREDRTSMAVLLIARVENPGLPPTWTLTLSLVSRVADGRIVATSNTLTDSGLAPPPGQVGRRLPGAPVARLVEAHAAQLARLGPPARLDDALDEHLRMERATMADRLRSGVYVEIEQGRVALSGPAFVGVLFRGINPVTAEPRATWINALLVVAIVGLGAAFAHAWVGPPPGSAVGLGLAFGALVLGTYLAFPKTSVLAVLFPMVAGLEAWSREESAYAQVGALVVGGAVGAFINKRRGTAPAADQGWLTTLRLVSLIAGLVVAVALYVAVRMPREAPMPPFVMVGVVVLLGGAFLAGLLTMALSLVPAVRGHLVFQLFALATQACFPSEVAFLVGFTDALESVSRNEASSQALVAAVRAHHARTGGLPATLDALVPTEIAKVPEVAVGWPGAKFDYEPAGATAFHLSHRSAFGRVDAHLSFPFGPSMPRVPIPVVPPSAAASGGAGVDDD